MALEQKIRYLEKITNINDKKYEIVVRRGLIVGPTEILWTDDEKRKYRSEQAALKQHSGNRTSHNGEGRKDLENDSGL